MPDDFLDVYTFVYTPYILDVKLEIARDHTFTFTFTLVQDYAFPVSLTVSNEVSFWCSI